MRPSFLGNATYDVVMATFDSQGLSDVAHDCGGRLKVLHGGWDDIRFHYALEEIVLDEEGRRLT